VVDERWSYSLRDLGVDGRCGRRCGFRFLIAGLVAVTSTNGDDDESKEFGGFSAALLDDV